jgi:aryl-alcohol dehydrogenase-like predicted oxidoreductase
LARWSCAAWSGGVGRPLTAGQPARILHAALDAGINYIEVAVDYGEAEEHIGRCIASRRQEFYLASKCGCPLDVSKFSPRERTRFGTPCPGCTTTAEGTSSMRYIRACGG